MNSVSPPIPTWAETAAALQSSNDLRTRISAMSIKPPDALDPRDVKRVLDAARAAEAAQRAGVDIKA